MLAATLHRLIFSRLTRRESSPSCCFTCNGATVEVALRASLVCLHARRVCVRMEKRHLAVCEVVPQTCVCLHQACKQTVFRWLDVTFDARSLLASDQSVFWLSARNIWSREAHGQWLFSRQDVMILVPSEGRGEGRGCSNIDVQFIIMWICNVVVGEELWPIWTSISHAQCSSFYDQWF